MADAPTVPRPQPIGVFALPAGYLLIGEQPAHDEVRAELVEGRRHATFPPSMRYYQQALDGDLAGALDVLTGEDAVTAVNRFVLDPSAAALDELRSTTTGELLAHVEHVAFSVGLRPGPPDPSSVDGEFAAMAHVARATAHLEHHDRAAAIEELEVAAQAAHPVSRPLAGQILGQLANTQLDEGGKQRATVTFEAAIDALTGTDLHTTLADLHVTFGAMFQEMSEAAPRVMKSAIDHYLAALQLVDATTAPETFAIANANLGLAYLMTPMHEASDLLRIGIAVQSMRDALQVFTADTHPERWSTTQLNLANALVYMPSKHQAENIAEAVELYEDVLQSRDRQSDPQGRARVLANQGNALAHLGHFDQAKARLHEARAIFEEFAEDDAVRTVRSILDEVAKQESILRQDRC
jgi:tetratricopeptide (TPR) repeat protein